MRRRVIVCDPVVRPERDVAGEHLVERDAGRVEIAAPVERMSAKLLGREVSRRAEDLSFRRLLHVVVALHDPEVHQVGPLVRVEDDVVGLDVAVHDAAPVDDLERVEERHEEPGRVLAAHPAVALEPRPQRGPVDELHRVPERPVGVSEVVDADDVRVLERGGDARLALEARRELRIAAPGLEEDLQRLDAVQPEIPHAVDGCESALPEEALERVAICEARRHGAAAFIQRKHAAILSRGRSTSGPDGPGPRTPGAPRRRAEERRRLAPTRIVTAAARIQGTSMKRPTSGQMFGSFGDADPAHDGHAIAPCASRTAARPSERRAARTDGFMSASVVRPGDRHAPEEVERVEHQEDGVEARERQRQEREPQERALLVLQVHVVEADERGLRQRERDHDGRDDPLVDLQVRERRPRGS